MVKNCILSIVLVFSFVIANCQDNNISFIENRNQWETEIKYKANIPGGALFLTENKLVYSFFSLKDLDRIHELKHTKADVSNEKVHFHAFDVSFINANVNPTLKSSKKRKEYHNYFLGNDQSKWAGNVPLFENVVYENIYNNIDLSFYSYDKSIKYDFIVKPSGNTNLIQLKYKGIQPSLKPNGDLLIKTSVNEFAEMAPFAYQIIDGKKQKVDCHFSITNNILTYVFPNDYNHSLELIIDPTLIFATYSGGTNTSYGFSATYDLNGSLYAGGEAFGTGWPNTTGAYQSTFGGSVDAGINKYTPTGNALVYSTYYGGSSSDLPNNMVVNTNNELVICGSTSSSNLPVTAGCFDNTLGGTSDVYVVHFNSTGTALIGATYVGGSGVEAQNSGTSSNYGDSHRGEVYIDANLDILCASSTSSNDFPVTAGCFQNTYGGQQDGCVFKLNPTCTSLIYSTYLGGSAADASFAININSANNIVVVGGTESTNFPTTAGALHNTFQGSTDGFATILNPTLSTVISSTFIGTSAYDHAFKLQIDPSDNIYVCGQSSGTYPITPGLYTNTTSGIFIDKLNPTLTASIASTVIGHVGLVPTAFLYDNCGNIYFAGFQTQSGLPLSANAFQTTQGGFWLCVLENNMTNLLYATYMGAAGDHVDGGTSRFDPQGIIYHSVCTASSSQYNSTGAWSPTNQAGSYDVASFKFDFEATGVNAICAISPLGNDSVCIPAVIPFVNNTTNATSYIWDFGDGTPTSTATNPTHTYTQPGTFTVTLIANNPNLCVTSDTATTTVQIFKIDKPILDLKDTVYCDPNALIMLNASVTNLNSNMTFSWSPLNAIVSGANTLNPIINPSLGNLFTLTVTDSVKSLCVESSTGIVNVGFGDTSLFKVHPIDTIVCYGEKVFLTAEGGTKYTWSPINNILDIHAAVAELNVYSPIDYAVLIEDNNGCKATRYTSVTIFPRTQVKAGDDDIVKYGSSVQLNSTGVKNYVWTANPTLSSTTISNPIASPINTTTYYVQGTDHNNCVSYDSTKVFITNGFIPNAFSPNGDGLNDKFRFITTNDYVGFKSLKVFNRYGQEIFGSYDKSSYWNGTYKGKPCENGTYFYLLEYSIGSKSYTEKGDINLIR